jgi:hypothetical protein
VLCNLSDVDCSLGIVVPGISQGAELAVLSANYSSQVQAVYALSGGSGAGWYIVQNWQNTSGTAGHCYFVDSTSVDVCAGIEDVNWRPDASYDWSLNTNLDWLATFGTQRNFSPTGY